MVKSALGVHCLQAVATLCGLGFRLAVLEVGV